MAVILAALCPANPHCRRLPALQSLLELSRSKDPSWPGLAVTEAGTQRSTWPSVTHDGQETSVLIYKAICRFSHTVLVIQHDNIVISLEIRLVYPKCLKTKTKSFTGHAYLFCCF